MRPLQKNSTLMSTGSVLVLLLAGCTGAVGNGGKSGGNGPSTGTTSGGGPTAAGTGNGGGVSSGATSTPGAVAGGANNVPGGSSMPGLTNPGTNPGTTGGGGAVTSAACDGVTARRLRRLSIREYSNVVTSLLGAPAGAAATAAITAEPSVDGFDNQAGSLFVSPSFQGDVADVAATLSSQADPAVLAPCTPATGSPACLQTFIRTFAAKAYGRPIADDELTRVNTMANMGQDYATQVRLVVEFILQSPGLLYVSELGAPTAPAVSGQTLALTQYEIASQLSFMLTGNRPDATLIKAAETTGFTKPTDILGEAQRLLTSDARAQDALTRFVNGWMDMSPLTDAPKDPTIYPTITPAIQTAMQQEYDQFVKAQLTGDGTLSALMLGTSANVPAALSAIYGTDLLPTGLDATKRKGILSLPAVLSVHSAPDNSGPVERGLLVRRQLLCQYVPGPPQNALDKIAANPIDASDKTTTTRQKLEAHLNEPSCAACHATFDPIGYGFEQMDAIGRFRTTENGKPVDSTGMLTGTTAPDGSSVDGPFQGTVQLATKLAQSKVVEACMTEHFFNFAQARATVASDTCVINDWTAKFSQGGGHIKDLVLNAVVHPNFANRKDDR
jgi:hypothetical protein